MGTRFCSKARFCPRMARPAGVDLQRFCRTTWCASLISVCGLLLLFPVAFILADESVVALPTDEQIQQWASDLDSGRFIDRQIATEQLVSVDRRAIHPVTQAVENGGPEVAARGVHVLRRLALSDNAQTSSAARTALERLATRLGSTAGRRATSTLDDLQAIWQQRAVDQILQLGGKIWQPQSRAGFQVADTAYSLEIGPEWTGGDAGLSHLTAFDDLHHLWLQGSQVTDGWLEQIGKLRQLRSVHIRQAEITDDGWSDLRDLSAMIRLDIWYTPVTDAAIPHLTSLEQVQSFQLYGTKISDQGLRKLLDAVKGANVDYKQGGFLGVGCQEIPHPQGCAINSVNPGSAAAKAEIRPGDIVVTYDEKKIENFAQLREAIGKNAESDRVSIEILRNNQKLLKQVDLGLWQFDHVR